MTSTQDVPLAGHGQAGTPGARPQEHSKRGVSPASCQRPDDASLQESLNLLLVVRGYTDAFSACGERPLTDIIPKLLAQDTVVSIL